MRRSVVRISGGVTRGGFGLVRSRLHRACDCCADCASKGKGFIGGVSFDPPDDDDDSGDAPPTPSSGS